MGDPAVYLESDFIKPKTSELVAEALLDIVREGYSLTRFGRFFSP
jgi:hypothetical protein